MRPAPLPVPVPRFGAHMSVAGGIHNAFEAGARVACESLQIFVKNQRQWSAPPLDPAAIEACREAATRTGLTPVVAHASYLLNLASPDAAQRKRSIDALLDELGRCEMLGVDHLVFHPGSTMGDTVPASLKRVAKGLDEVRKRAPGDHTMILIECTAGAGNTVGRSFEELAGILDGLRRPERVGLCLDTCHLFAAGYDFRKEDAYQEMVARLDSLIGTERVRCIHVNDSKGEAGSHLDRHEHIGKGRIGKAGFAHFVNDPRFASLPMILETPKGKDGRGTDLDKVNLKRLRAMLRG